MALGFLDSAKLTAIADAIRSKTGKSATMTVDEMPEEIESIETGGGGEIGPFHDGASHLVVAIPHDEYKLSINISYSTPGDMTIDWGDGGSDVWTASGRATVSHVYQVKGRYDIAFMHEGGADRVVFGGTSTSYSVFQTESFTNTTIRQSVVLEYAELANGDQLSSYAFYNCEALKKVCLCSDVRFYSSTGNAFYGCHSLVDVTGLEFINNSFGNQTFYYCYSLKNISEHIFEQGSTIGTSCFSFCHSLDSVTIPENITKINNSAFAYCKNVTKFRMLSSTPPTIGNAAFSNTGFPIYVPAEAVDAYKDADNWSTYASRIMADPEE